MMPSLPAITAALAADIPILLWGAPGTGKTAAIVALAATAGAHVETLIGSTLDPTDIARPSLDGAGQYVLSAAPWARRLRAALDAGKPAWLFLDELSCAPPSVQAALLRVVHDRVVGEVSLRGCRVLAAANPADTAADGGDLSAAMAGRWAHLPWEPDAADWCAGELAGWGEPSAETAPARALICAWIGHRPDALLVVPPAGQQDLRGWPSPRSWSAVARGLAAISPDPQAAVRDPAGRMLLAGLVGPAAATEIAAYAADVDLPDPAALLAGKSKLPARGDRAALCLMSCLAHALATQAMPAYWSLLETARLDVALVHARAGVRACAVAKIIPEGEAFLRLTEKIK